MSKDTEKVFKELHEFLDLHQGEVKSEEDMNELVAKFVSGYNASLDNGSNKKSKEKTADDYLEIAEEAETKSECRKYIKKALELEPDNVDARLHLINVDYEEKIEERIKALVELKEEAAKQIEEYFESDEGEFWGIIETRPYMRVCKDLYSDYIESGRIRLAMKECQNVLKLNLADNMGMRNYLMHIYAYIEDEARALALHRRFENSDECQMLLPLAYLYYKLNKLDEAEKYLKRLSDVNPDTEKFFKILEDDDIKKFFDYMNPYGYKPYTIEELADDYMSNMSLWTMSHSFTSWAYKCVKKFDKKPKKKASKSNIEVRIR